MRPTAEPWTVQRPEAHQLEREPFEARGRDRFERPFAERREFERERAAVRERRIDPQIGQMFREAEQALHERDTDRAEEVLARIDRALGEEAPPPRRGDQIREAIEQAERAIEEDDPQRARQAVQHMRQVMQQEQALQQPIQQWTAEERGQQQPTGAQPSQDEQRTQEQRY